MLEKFGGSPAMLPIAKKFERRAINAENITGDKGRQIMGGTMAGRIKS